MGGNAGDIDDTTPAGLHHGGPNHLAGKECTTDEVQIKVGHPILNGDFRKRIFGCDCHAGIVAASRIHKHTWNPECVCGEIQQVHQTLAVGGIGLKKDRPASRLRDFTHLFISPLDTPP